MMGGESRRARFEAGERAALDPLPEYPWKWGVVKPADWTPIGVVTR